MVTPNDVETKAAGDAAPAKRAKDDNTNVDLKEFDFKEVLSSDASRKSLFILIEHNISKQQGILTCDKQAFSEDGTSIAAWLNRAAVKTVAINDIYCSYVLTLPDEFNGVKSTLIYPATEKHIIKYRRQDVFIVYENAEDYNTITKPYFESLNNVNWVYNILDGNAEQDRVLYHDKSDETGFLLAPDLKWDGIDVESLYYQAIVQRRDIGSVRALTKEHIPLLKAIRDKSTELIRENFGLTTSQLKFYVHYLPTYFHFHVHIVNIKYDAPGCTMTCIPLQEIIDNLEIWPDFYQRATLTFVKTRNDPILQKFVAAGRVELQ
jgi:m7GpppX diphosphatase